MGRTTRKCILITVLSLALYCASYWVIREAHTVRYERDGCPRSGCEEVYFPGDGLYLVYGPLYQLDKLTDGGTDFVVLRRN